jgi:hypothetical protein
MITSRPRFVATIVLAAVVGATQVSASIIVNTKTGLFGLTAGQTARINIVNAQAKGGVVPCVGVFDMDGRQLAEFVADRPLAPGEGMSFDFNADTLGLRGSERMQVRAEVRLQPPDPAQPPDPTQPPDPGQPPDPAHRRRAALITLEVFDNASGKTMFLVPFQPPDPQTPPDPNGPAGGHGAR